MFNSTLNSSPELAAGAKEVSPPKTRGRLPVRCSGCGSGNIRVSTQDTLLVVIMACLRFKALRCRECRKQFFVPRPWAVNAQPAPEREPAAPQEAQLLALAATAGSSSSFGSASTLVNRILPTPEFDREVLLAQFPTTDLLESEPVPALQEPSQVLLVSGPDFVELQQQKAAACDGNGTVIFSLLGWEGRAQAASQLPVFLIPEHLAPELELYPLEVTDGRRLLIYGVRNKRVAFPNCLRIARIWEGLSSVQPAAPLAPGEYTFKSKSSDYFFPFSILPEAPDSYADRELQT